MWNNRAGWTNIKSFKKEESHHVKHEACSPTCFSRFSTLRLENNEKVLKHWDMKSSVCVDDETRSRYANGCTLYKMRRNGWKYSNEWIINLQRQAERPTVTFYLHVVQRWRRGRSLVTDKPEHSFRGGGGGDDSWQIPFRKI